MNGQIEKCEWWLYNAGAGRQMIFYDGDVPIERACKNDPEIAEIWKWVLEQQEKGNLYLQHSNRGYIAVRTHARVNPVIFNQATLVDTWLNVSKPGETVTLISGRDVNDVVQKDAGAAHVVEKFRRAADAGEVELDERPRHLVAKRLVSNKCSTCPDDQNCCYPKCKDI